MSKNLCSKLQKELQKQEEDGNKSIQEFRILVANLTAKIDELTAASKSRHVDILNRLQWLVEKSTSLCGDIRLKMLVEFANSEVQVVKTSLAAKADLGLVDKLTLVKRVDDLENRSKRNNIVIWNVLEDAEKQFSSCEALVKSILSDFMGLDEDIEVMRAHRNAVQNRRGATLARAIHVALLRFTDKQYILRDAVAKLKDHPFKEANLFISDNVSREVHVRED